ncbi:MAG: hypothetical protein DRP85_00355 [Candidatus Makaraimicrobium thalassicum]|nr:MAG: hypothetical protein DRP85_00355 [Candidatus Omnitrophota bacterium]
MKIKTRRYYLYYSARVLFFLVRLIPLRISQTIAVFLGKAAFRLVRKYRGITIANLDAVFSSDHKSNLRIAERVFENIARTGAEWIKLSSLDPKRIDDLVTEFQGAEYLDDTLSEGKGAIVLGFHFGNWELLGLYLRQKGYEGNAVVRRIYFHKYDELLMQMRRRFGVEGIYRDEFPKKILRLLKKGGTLGILADQDVDSVDGIFVDFFGRPAYTPTAPVKLAMAAKTKIIPAFVIRKPDNTYRIVLEKPIDPSSGDSTRQEDVKRYTRLWTAVLEEYVKRYPEQWVWLHSRWKTKEAAG